MASNILRRAIHFTLMRHDPRVKRAEAPPAPPKLQIIDEVARNLILGGLPRPWTTKELEAAQRRVKRWERNIRNSAKTEE